MTMTRKQFLGALLGGAGAVALVACGGDDGGGATIDAAGGSCASTNVNIEGNHGHVLMVSAADVTAAADKTYDITGSATHAHSVTVTAANFATLAANGSVMVTSTSGGGHTHGVTVMCA